MGSGRQIPTVKGFCEDPNSKKGLGSWKGKSSNGGTGVL